MSCCGSLRWLSLQREGRPETMSSQCGEFKMGSFGRWFLGEEKHKLVSLFPTVEDGTKSSF